MSNATFKSAGQTFNMTINPAISATNGNKYPVIFLIHGNAGLISPFGEQIQGFAKDLANLGYMTVVPEYYNANHLPNVKDETPHDKTLTDAIEAIKSTRTDADLNRLGLISFSLGAATAMTYIASTPKGTVKVFADFFGFLTQTITDNVSKFPPTIILHNNGDKIVKIYHSENLEKSLKDAHIQCDFKRYDEAWKVNFLGRLLEIDHSFEPNGNADVDSRKQTTDWFIYHLPPVGNN